MNKYRRLQAELAEFGTGRMKGFGPSMLPVLVSGSTLTYVKSAAYRVKDIVFCRVRGRWTDAHHITATKTEKGKAMFLISNNHGHDNGWTSADHIYGRVVMEERPDGSTGYTSRDYADVCARFADNVQKEKDARMPERMT